MAQHLVRSSNGHVAADLTGLYDQLDAVTNPERIREFLELLVYEAQQLWVQAVSGMVLPGMTRPVHSDEYASAILDPSALAWEGDDTVSITINEPAADRIEEGYPAYDMKPGLLASQKAHHSASNTTYLDVPFRHGTPASPGDGPNPKRAHFYNTMPQNVYKMVRDFTTDSPDRLGDTDASGNPFLQTVKPQSGGMTAPYVHASSIWSGMQKKGDAGNSAYLTFRRVSSESDQNSWWHPGVPANPVTQAVADALQERLPKLAQAYLKQFS